MRVGNGNGEGLVNAAEHSPALRLCGPADVDPTDPGDGGGGPIQDSCIHRRRALPGRAAGGVTAATAPAAPPTGLAAACPRPSAARTFVNPLQTKRVTA